MDLKSIARDAQNINRLRLWIRVQIDFFANSRGFSLRNRCFPCADVGPVMDEMVSSIDDSRATLQCYRVRDEDFRALCPEMSRYEKSSRYWLFPVEFVEPFLRPISFKLRT